MSTKAKSVIYVLGVLLLTVGIVVQLTGFFRAPGLGRGKHLARIFEDSAANALSVGATEFGTQSVLNTLRCDDILYQEYQFKGGALRMYVAYWAPSKTPAQLVASHTPDWCWSAAGWTCSEMRFLESAQLGVALLPAEWRVFRAPTADQKPQYVLYWHLVGGRLYDYGRSFNFLLNPFKWWRDFVVHSAVGTSEQYFIRLSSDVPIETLQADPAFVALLERLAKLGLAAK